MPELPSDGLNASSEPVSSERFANERFRGKNALITGGSLGIGRETALALARQGANVAVNYRSHGDQAQQVVEAARQMGVQAMAVQADVAEQNAVEQMVAHVVQQWGRLDIAVSNAAYSDRDLFYQADMAGFRRTVDVTMWGAFYLLRASANQMIEQFQNNAPSRGKPSREKPSREKPSCEKPSSETPGANQARGVIVLVSSPHAYIAAPRAMAYNMSKAALEHMAKTAAIELAEHRIRVNMIQPGWTDTPGERKFASEETLQNAGAKIPLGRLGNPEEMAEGIVFLCDPRNEYMTGATLLIDGGISLPWWANRGSAAPE